MIRCITIGSSIVQGALVRKLSEGRAEIRVGDVIYSGALVPSQTTGGPLCSDTHSKEGKSK